MRSPRKEALEPSVEISGAFNRSMLIPTTLDGALQSDAIIC